MPNFFDIFKQKNNYKKIFPIIFAVDSSGSMDGKRISYLNSAIETIIKNFIAYNSNEENELIIRMAILKFSSGSQWVTDGLMNPADIKFSGISCGGVTDLGSALNELNQKLSRKVFFSDVDSYVAPFICFVTDGMPTDNYAVPLEKLNKNRWYKQAKKVAVSIGDVVDFDALNGVVGNSEAIVRLNSEVLLESVLVGLCSSWCASCASLVNISVVAQPKPPKPFTKNELDLDNLCFPKFSVQPTEFDSDCFAQTCILESPEPTNDNNCDDSGWGDDDWDDWDEMYNTAKPVATSADNEFDSDQVCCSRVASLPVEFDSDCFAQTCILESPEPTNDNNCDDSGWGDDDWDGWDTPSQTSSYDSGEHLKESLDSLRYGESVGFSISESVNDNSCNSSIGIQVPDGKPVGGRAIGSSCKSMIVSGFKFCPECGTPVLCNSSHKVNVSQVQFSAIVPKRFIKGDYAMIDISVYDELYRNIVDRIIANSDEDVKEVVASAREIADNTVIRIELTSPDIELVDCDETQKWQGKYLTFSFPVEIPRNYAKKQVLFIAMVCFNDVIATKLKFIANCSCSREQKTQLTREDVLTAFMSYASQDRSRVATIIQGMKKARPDMDIFFDVDSLRSGEDWESVLQFEIEKRDVLFLCWSNYARDSKWVEKEWRYALSNKGIDAIEPVPLVSPVECPPPEELKSKHFNDRALFYR